MRPKLNLKDKGQISKPNKYTDNFKYNLTCIFLCQGQIKENTLPSDTVYNASIGKGGSLFFFEGKSFAKNTVI